MVKVEDRAKVEALSVRVSQLRLGLMELVLPQRLGAILQPHLEQSEHPIQPNEAAICMALVKISRQAEDPAYLDNYEDAIAYLSIGKSITDAMQDDTDDWKD